MVNYNAFLGQDLSTWTNKDQEVANLLLALAIAGSNLPVTFVNNPFFKSYINHLNPQVVTLLISYFHGYMCNCFRRRWHVS